MILTLTREIFTNKSTIGKLYIEGEYECFTLEDKYREYKDTEAIFEIAFEKVQDETAIPTGRYKVIITYSNRFKRNLPLLLNVPGFKGIRIHSGNKPENTSGCILVGVENPKPDWISHSILAFDSLYNKIKHAIDNNEDVYIRIE